MRKTFITTMPDKSGAFLLASEVVSKHGGNIVRVSYNKAVDMHTLFLDVNATKLQLTRISNELLKLDYLLDDIEQVQIMLVEFLIRDIPGGVLPILKILNKYEINISYINSEENGTQYQSFKMGLLIYNSVDVKNLLDEISKICEVRIIDYSGNEKILDNTVFYYSFANEISTKLALTQSQRSAVLAESNRIMQILDSRGELPHKTFNYIRKFADFIVRYKADNFIYQLSSRKLSEQVKLYTIEVPCGSNTYILQAQDELLFIDSGFAAFKDEMFQLFYEIFPNFDSLSRTIWITHSDIDHCGLLPYFTKVGLNKKSAENFALELKENSNFREQNKYNAAYCRLSRIISNYKTPNLESLYFFDTYAPDYTQTLSKIADLEFADLKFEVYEGNGGHVDGEMIYLCREHSFIFTGDNLVNFSAFSKEQAEFNILAPYLMTSVNIDSAKATQIRKAILDMLQDLEQENKRACLVFAGHGANSCYENKQLSVLSSK